MNGKKTEKRFSLNRLHKLYPLAKSDSALLDTSLVVDAAVVRLAKNITLPMEDSASFTDPLDGHIENIEVAIRQDVPKDDIIKALEELKISADFVGGSGHQCNKVFG